MSRNLTIVRLPAEQFITEEDVVIRAMEEGRSEAELTLALFRLKHAFEYSQEFRQTTEWPFKPTRERIS